MPNVYGLTTDYNLDCQNALKQICRSKSVSEKSELKWTIRKVQKCG